MSPASQVSFTFQIDIQRREGEGEDRLTVKFLLVDRRWDELVAHDRDDGVFLLGFLAIQVSFHVYIHLKRTKGRKTHSTTVLASDTESPPLGFLGIVGVVVLCSLNFCWTVRKRPILTLIDN